MKKNIDKKAAQQAALCARFPDFCDQVIDLAHQVNTEGIQPSQMLAFILKLFRTFSMEEKQLVTPELGKEYYYLRPSLLSDSYEVHSSTWTDSLFDKSRMLKFNAFVNHDDAQSGCLLVNEMLSFL